MKKIIACIILLVAVVSAFIIVLCDNENSTEGTTYELSSGNFDFDKTWSNLALYKTSNLSYTPLPYEYSSDIYSTYYSYKLCDELDIPILEVHILDFTLQIYDWRLYVQFLRKIRPEYKFNTTDELSAQLEEDKAKIRDITSKEIF